MNSIRDLGAAVRAHRRDLGMSQEELSRRAHVSRPWLSKLEAGQHPRAEVQKVLDVLSALGLSLTISEAANGGITDPAVEDPFSHFFGTGS